MGVLNLLQSPNIKPTVSSHPFSLTREILSANVSNQLKRI